jgi:fructosamine-3-kinase
LLEAELSDRCDEVRPVSGGDIADSYRVDLASGDRLFAKVYSGGPSGIGEAEARGLEWLREVDALRVPAVFCHGLDWLALEWIEPARPRPDFADRLGSGLADIHRQSRDTFGFDEDNWIGSLSQSNAQRESWDSFYAECRLRPLQQRALSAGTLSRDVIRLLDEVIETMPELVGPSEAPSRLHGDLWSGNLMIDESGLPCLIDPAVYAGHREVDLAMMKLFGGFERRVFDAYREAFPLSPGSNERVDLYQVYPLLVHVCLFGAGYVERLEHALRAALERK